jgi:hypothetical protein
MCAISAQKIHLIHRKIPGWPDVSGFGNSDKHRIIIIECSIITCLHHIISISYRAYHVVSRHVIISCMCVLPLFICVIVSIILFHIIVTYIISDIPGYVLTY